MAGFPYVFPYQETVNAGGLALSGSYFHGTKLAFLNKATNFPAPVYINSGMTVQAANPTPSDSNGQFGSLFLDPSITYKTLLYSSAGTIIFSQDPVPDTGQGGGGGDGSFITPEQFGAVGNGFVDDTDALILFFAAVQGKTGYLAGVYLITSTITTPLIDCTLLGVWGQSKIFGNIPSTILLDLTTITNTIVDGIIFSNAATIGVRDSQGSINISRQDVTNLTIRFCYFSSPNAEIEALFISSFQAGGDPTHTINGFYFYYNIIENHGGQGMTLMNRSYGKTDPYQYFTKVRIYKNVFRNTGLVGAEQFRGMAVSLDGYGRDCWIDDNLFDNIVGAGLENTGWQVGQNTGNVLMNPSRGANLYQFTGRGAGDPGNTLHPITDWTSRDNKVAGDATGALANFISAMDESCVVDNDYLVADTTNYTTVSRDSTGVIIRNLTSINIATNGDGAFLCDSATGIGSRVTLVDPTLDTTASLSNVNVLNFSGALSTGSRVVGSNINLKKGTGGGYVGQGTGVLGNSVDPFFSETGELVNGLLTLSASGDADQVIAGGSAAQAFNTMIFSGGVAWTGPHALDWSSAAIFARPNVYSYFRHTKEFNATIKINGVLQSGSTMTPNRTFVLTGKSSGAVEVLPLGPVSATTNVDGITVRGDASATLAGGIDNMTQVWNTPFTGGHGVTATGTANGQTFVIIRDTGATGAFTLNVNSGLVILSTPGTYAIIEFDGATWWVTAQGSVTAPSPDVPGITTVGDVGATLTAGVSTSTQIWNTPFTGDHTVTLVGSVNGQKFRIVRNAGATGAHNLNVGTGPLKVLAAAGAWVDVEYDGSAWNETASGTL